MPTSAATRVRAAVVVLLAACAVLAGCTAPHAGTHPAGTSGPRRPNIVLVLTDDLSMNLLPYLPQVQAMQREGVTMSRYYVVDSLCCPSRAAILTGKFPHDDGVYRNNGVDGGYRTFNRDGNEPDTFGVALQKVGYRTAFLGKYLNGYYPALPPAPGWDEWDVAGNGYPEFGYGLRVNGAVVHHGHAPTDYLTDVIARRGVRFIADSARAHRPFLIELASFAPHQPATPAPRDAHAFAGLRAPRGPAYDRLPTGAPSWLNSFLPLSARDEAGIDALYRRRVQSIQAVDRMIAAVRAQLGRSGVADDTYLVFSSDNGFHLGEHRLRPGKQTAFDTDIHVPLVIVGPHVPRGRVVSDLASSIDLAPTFESLAAAPTPASADGTSLAGLWHGQRPDRWQQAVLVEHHGTTMRPDDPDFTGPLGGNPPTYEAIRTAGALYAHYADGTDEYYDTRSDPAELHNLGAGAVPASLRRALTALSTCHGATACQAAARLH